MTYVESLKNCKRLADQFQAEYEGLICAAWSDECNSGHITVDYLRVAFERGFKRGKEHIYIEAALAKQKEAV